MRLVSHAYLQLEPVGDVMNDHQPAEIKDTSREEERAWEATKAAQALHAGGRQHQRVKEDPASEGTSQATAAAETLHVGHRQHRHIGEDPAWGRAVETLETVKSLHTGHLQHQITGEELTQGRVEEDLNRDGERGSVGGRKQAQALERGVRKCCSA